jgi:C4-dicarboxylate-specific signal transduction histidine kinase
VSEDERAGEVIKRLRALLKPGQTQLQPLSASEIVEDVLRIARSDLIERGVKVHAELDGSAPPIVGDRVQLQQVLLNLILNAGDAMAANPPADRHLTIAAAHCDGRVCISVSDTGCGLPPDAERIFEPFYTTKEEGLGLGLPICRSIVGAHNGRLWAEANMAATSRGTTFHVELPAAKTAE